MRKMLEGWFWRTWAQIARPLALIITGMAMMFMMTGYKGLQGDNYMTAVVLIALSYIWLLFMFWLNFIKDTIWDR